MTDKTIIKDNFTRNAYHYDNYACVQNKCAARLIGLIKDKGFDNILDIGCGTGNYTRLLNERYSRARIKAVDLSSEMIAVARDKIDSERVRFLVADAETMDFGETFNLITSNATFQWFRDLHGSLVEYRRWLYEEGIILFSIFGPDTFCELNKCLMEYSGGEFSITSNAFIKLDNVEKMLRKLFSKVHVEYKVYEQKYPSLLDLLKTIKYTGTRGNGLGMKGFWTPRRLASIEDIYTRNFKDIVISYEVLFCRGMR